ncbi:hypothetical protein AB4Y95_00310 [Arthrobacter sp. M-10]|uniref:hypothetical protein n=1 Tax=Arthrobacter sp. M-10 TaxID=3233037 RepID=UPI003F916753
MEVENYQPDSSDFDGPLGPCIACLYEEELDNNSLCAGCRPSDPEMLKALTNLLKPAEPAV